MEIKRIGNAVRHKSVIRIVLIVALLLLIPLLVMLFTDKVNWSVGDFALAGVLLLGAGLAYELLARRVTSVAGRIAVGIAILAILFLVWVELAVGIFRIY